MPCPNQECIVTTINNGPLYEINTQLAQTSHNSKEEIKNKKFTTLNELNLQLKLKVNTYQHSINECNDTIHNLKIQKNLAEKIYYKRIIDYENQIVELKVKNEELTMNLNNKIYSLLKALQEKEHVIDKLRKMLEK